MSKNKLNYGKSDKLSLADFDPAKSWIHVSAIKDSDLLSKIETCPNCNSDNIGISNDKQAALCGDCDNEYKRNDA